MSSKNETLARGLARRAKAVADLEEDLPEVAEVADACLEFTQSYVATYIAKDPAGSVLLLQLAQTIFSYLEDSFYLACEGKLDQSAALCRMASEATRVLCRLSEDPDNEALFLGREVREKEYRKVFRFRNDVPMEQLLKQMYEIFSEHGVHGHFLTFGHLEPYDYIDGGRFVELRVPDVDKYARILLWMRVYRVVATLVVRALAAGNDCMLEARKVMEGFLISLDDVISSVEKALKDEKTA